MKKKINNITCTYLVVERIESFENKLKQSFEIFGARRRHEDIRVTVHWVRKSLRYTTLLYAYFKFQIL